MSASKHVTLWCDATDDDGVVCVEMIEVGSESIVVEARRYAARNHGWVYRARRDLCPFHASANGGQADG